MVQTPNPTPKANPNPRSHDFRWLRHRTMHVMAEQGNTRGKNMIGEAKRQERDNAA